jgi:tetratricopeptide (TPR) repeat protein
MSRDDLDALRRKLGVSGGGGVSADDSRSADETDPTLVSAHEPRSSKPPPSPEAQLDEEEVTPISDADVEEVLEVTPISISDVEEVLEIGSGEIIDFQEDVEEEHTKPFFVAAGPYDLEIAQMVQPVDPELVDAAGVIDTAPEENAEIFYRREAEALATKQPEQAAAMWLAAARTAERSGAPSNEVVALLDRTVELAPASPSLVPLARRTALRLRRHELALRLTKQLERVGLDNAARVGALIEASAQTRFHFGRGQEALAYLDQALSLQPGHTMALITCASLHLELEQHEPAAARLEQLADVLNSPQERATCLYLAGTIQELRLDSAEAAEQAYTRALEFDPEHLPALQALSQLHQLTHAWPRLCVDLERLAALEVDATSRARDLLRAGTLHLYRTGDLEAAARDLAGAATVASGTDPGSPAALQEIAALTRLAYVHEATGHHEALIGTLRQLLCLTVDAPGRAALLTRVGWLLQSRSGDLYEAISAYQQALQQLPGHVPALQALGTLYRQLEDRESLLGILQPDVEGTAPPARRAIRCFDVARLQEQLGRPHEAIDSYRRALELDPELLLAAWRLATLLRRHERHAELADLIVVLIGRSTDDRTQHHLLLELADLQAGVLAQPEQAMETLLRASPLRETRSGPRRLGALYERCGHHVDHVELLLTEANDTRDVAEAKWLRLQAALILEEHLGEDDRAMAILSQVIEQHPASAGAIHAAGRILHRLGRWTELIDLHQHELAVDPEVEVPGLWCRIGRIYEDNLGQTQQSIDAYMAALKIDVGHSAALEPLERLVRGEERFEELVELLRRFAETRTEPFAAADALSRAAELAETRLFDPGRAASLFGEAIACWPEAPVALVGLYNVQLQQGDHGRAAETLGRLIELADNDIDRSHLRIQLARQLEYRLGEPPDPALIDAAAAGSPFGTRLRAERLRARRCAPGADPIEVLLELGGQTPDAGLAAAYLLEVAHRLELAGDVAGHLAAAEQAYARSPEGLAPLWSLQRGARDAGHLDVLGRLLENEAEREVDPTLRLHLLEEAGQSYLSAGRPQDAVRLANQCLGIDPLHLPSLRMRAELAGEASAWAEQAPLLDQQAEACQDRTNRLRLSLQAADLWSDRLNNPQRALISLKLALADDPDQAEAYNRAERLLERLGEVQQLLDLNARRVEACADVELKIDLLRRQAALARDKLGSAAQAITALKALLGLRSDDRLALAELAELLQREHRWSDATEALERLINVSEGPSQQRARIELATIRLRQLQQPDLARKTLQQALDAVPNLEARRLLVEVAFLQGAWDEARNLLTEIEAEEVLEQRVWAKSQLAELARIGLRDGAEQERYEREALELAVSNEAALRIVTDRYRERDQQSRLVDLGAVVLTAGLDDEATARLRSTLARVLLDDLNQPKRALDYLRQNLSLVPEDTITGLLFARAQEQRGDVEAAVGWYRKLLGIDITCVEAYRGLSRLMTVLGDTAVASSALAALALLKAATAPELDQLRALRNQGAPRGGLDPRRLKMDAELRTIARYLAPALPYLAPVFGRGHGAGALPPSSPAASAATQLARQLGIQGVQVVPADRGARMPAEANLGEPPVIALSAALIEAPTSAGFRFWTVRALTRAVTTGALLDHLGDRELAQLIEALSPDRSVSSTVQQLRKRVHRALPRKIRKQIEQLPTPRVDAAVLARLRQAEGERADQVAMAASADPLEVFKELAKNLGISEMPLSSERVREMVTFAVSQRYTRLYNVLWRGGSMDPS